VVGTTPRRRSSILRRDAGIGERGAAGWASVGRGQQTSAPIDARAAAIRKVLILLATRISEKVEQCLNRLSTSK
jgi:hypothetical protein